MPVGIQSEEQLGLYTEKGALLGDGRQARYRGVIVCLLVSFCDLSVSLTSCLTAPGSSRSSVIRAPYPYTSHRKNAATVVELGLSALDTQIISACSCHFRICGQSKHAYLA